MAITIQHTYTCDVCGLKITSYEATDNFPAAPGFLERKDLPKSWTWVGRSLVCHRHDIAVAKAARGEQAMAMTVLLRRGYKDDEAGYRPDEIDDFDEPWPDGVNPQFDAILPVLMDAALDPLTWVTMPSPGLMQGIDLASTPPDKVP